MFINKVRVVWLFFVIYEKNSTWPTCNERRMGLGFRDADVGEGEGIL